MALPALTSRRTKWVGVVRGVRRNAREAPERYFYLPALQTEADLISTRYLVRTGPEAGGGVFADIRAAIRGEERRSGADIEH